jgi:hypothetical protein
MQHLIDQIQANSSIILGALFVLSEALALIPSVKANSVFQLVQDWIVKNQPPKS